MADQSAAQPSGYVARLRAAGVNERDAFMAQGALLGVAEALDRTPDLTLTAAEVAESLRRTAALYASLESGDLGD